MKGRLIVIEGLDGSGKATQTAILCRKLREMGLEADNYSFPDYESESSLLVRMYLDGKFGDDPNSVTPYTASCFFACDRYASYKTKWMKDYENGHIIICDRYTTSNAVHQCSKLPQGEWDSFIEWLYDFEYVRMGLPKPDLVICLDLEVELAEQLMRHREQKLGTQPDIHEKDLQYLRRCRQVAREAADYFGWSVIPCEKGGVLRPVGEIHEEIYELVRTCLEG